MSWAFACVFGAEHYATLEGAATKLLQLGESATFAWPLPWLMGVWEELWARMIEEMRQIDRELRRLMGEESPNFERVRFFAASPDERGDPWLRTIGLPLSCLQCLLCGSTVLIYNKLKRHTIDLKSVYCENRSVHLNPNCTLLIP